MSTITFIPLFGPITKLSLSFVTFRVSRFPVSHLTHETVKLGLQNTLNMSKTTRVYFGVLQLVPFTRKNQSKALQAKGRNFLSFVHDPSALMGECKETREMHLMVVKGR